MIQIKAVGMGNIQLENYNPKRKKFNESIYGGVYVEYTIEKLLSQQKKKTFWSNESSGGLWGICKW